MERPFEIEASDSEFCTVLLDGLEVPARAGESVLATLMAHGIRAFSENDHGQVVGVFCGMGVCHCCLVEIDGHAKQRACRTEVKPGTQIQTQARIRSGRGEP